MLFTDDYPVTTAQVASLESEALQIANIEKIDLLTVMGVATAECSHKILSAVRSFGIVGAPGLNADHLAAVLYTGLRDAVAPKIRLGQVFVSNLDSSLLLSPLQLWVAYRTLSLLFRDAVTRNPSLDKYLMKYELYDRLGVEVFDTIRRLGIPIVQVPFPRPGARLERDAGTFSSNNVTAVAGGADPGGTYDVAITWVDLSTYVSPEDRFNGESAPSDRVGVTLAANERLRVSLAGLNPPTGAIDGVGISRGLWTTRQATHWLIYAGEPGGELFLQTATPIAVTTTAHTLSAAPVLTGYRATFGQYPDLNLALRNTLYRG